MSIGDNDRHRDIDDDPDERVEKKGRPKNGRGGGKEIDRSDVSDGCTLAKAAAFSMLGAAWPSHRVR